MIARLSIQQSIPEAIQWYMIYALINSTIDANEYVLYANESLEWEQQK